jgi:hypothetical protein
MAPRQASPAAAALNALGVSLSKESISKDQLLSVLKARRDAPLRAPRLCAEAVRGAGADARVTRSLRRRRLRRFTPPLTRPRAPSPRCTTRSCSRACCATRTRCGRGGRAGARQRAPRAPPLAQFRSNPCARKSGCSPAARWATCCAFARRRCRTSRTSS